VNEHFIREISPNNFGLYVLIKGGELFDRIVQKTFYNEKEAKDLVQILLSAIKYCHDRNIVHRDLKPENLLLTSKKDDADVKIADFGFAVECADESLTARYDMAIEMFTCVMTVIRNMIWFTSDLLTNGLQLSSEYHSLRYEFVIYLVQLVY
jgi:serine/threonine protein kinase